ncbi:MAG: hypothetical protein RRC07_08390 [Anaerolineae bacterium]|nr:hypothetical protein [Anaerolineae bacterium]
MATRPRLLRLFGFALIVIAVLLAVYVTVAYLAYQSGQELGATRIAETRSAAVHVQLERAEAEIGEGNPRLALRRLEWVLEREPANELAQQLQAEAQRALQTPTPNSATATPETVTPAPSPAVGETGDARELRRLERLVEQEAWEEAISAILAFQAGYPSVERRRTDELLQRAYIGRGVEELYGQQVELGIYYLAQAEALGTLPQEVQDQRLWAELYLGGIAYYGVNWEVSLFYFRQLCPAAPFYQDACNTLFEILIRVGDLYAAQQDWCPAEPYYQEALSVLDTNTAAQKLRQARDGCREATPTASAPLTGTVPVDGPGIFTDTTPVEPEP